MLSIPWQDDWNYWLRRSDDGFCSGLNGGCEYCLEKMYKKRHTYLTSYIRVFIDNVNDLASEKIKMPELEWYPAPTANLFDVEEYHVKKCTYGAKFYWMCKQLFIEDVFLTIKKYLTSNDTNICPCETALLFRCMYGKISEKDNVFSLDIIWGRYKNLRKQINKI